jgi:hypothetical protein
MRGPVTDHAIRVGHGPLSSAVMFAIESSQTLGEVHILLLMPNFESNRRYSFGGLK